MARTLSEYASIGMIILGLVTFPIIPLAGLLLVVLGVAMYLVHRRVTRRPAVGPSTDEAGTPQSDQ